MRRLSVSKQKEIFDSGSGKAKFFIGEKSERLAWKLFEQQSVELHPK